MWGHTILSVKHSDETLQLVAKLRDALEREEFRVYYQPKLNLAEGKIVGVEALIRWEHPEKRVISPFEFIPLAEESGLILPIGEWILRTACKQNKTWQEAGLPPMIMAVNLSVRQLYQPHLVERVERILEETGLAPEYLELEITESMMMDVHHVLPILQKLKQIGVRISLDDFGTGYSSLYYLKEFPIDIIKVDQSFVQKCTLDMKDATIVKAIIAMAHQLNVQVVAEGIETKEQLIFLQQNLCNQGQGYLFSKPLPAEELVQNFLDIEQVIHRDGIPKEISKQKWLEQALENARNELRETVRLQQGMIFKYKEKDGKFIHTLCDGELLYKVGLTPEQLIGKELHEVLPKEVADRKLQCYRRAWNGEENVTYEGERNGVWYLATLRPIRRGGQVVEVIASCVDITERKESEERYKRLVEVCPEPIVVHQEGRIQYANPAFIKLLGASSLTELIGKEVTAFSPPEYVEMVEHRIQELNQTGITVAPTEEKVISLDGTIIEVEVTGISFNYSGKPSYLMILHDLTPRKQVEVALRQSEEKYRLIAENMQDLIGVLDTNGVVKYASPSHKTILGFSPNVYVGHLAFDMVHPDDIPEIQMQFAHMVASKTPCRIEFRYKHIQGGWVYVEAFGNPVLNEQGEVEHIVIVARDISERKRAEESIRKSEKLSVVGKMAAGVAHEIRNPLTSIKGFAQLLQKEAENPFYFDMILSEINRLEEIIRGFLTLAKPQNPQIKEVDVNNLLQQVVQLFNTQAILNNVEIIQECDSDLPRIQCDENQIKQVLLNILQNAVEAMSNGGIINIQMFRHASDSIQFRCIDQGCGIPEERLKHIGEPFFSTKEKGTGLGLMLSQRIIQEHGGTISIESSINQGTTVDIILPIHHSYMNEH